MNVMYASDVYHACLISISTISFFNKDRERKRINVFLLKDQLSKENEPILKGIAVKSRQMLMQIDVKQVEKERRTFA